jgi:hypothetical protein
VLIITTTPVWSRDKMIKELNTILHQENVNFIPKNQDIPHLFIKMIKKIN